MTERTVVKVRSDGSRLIVEAFSPEFDPDEAATKAWEIRKTAFARTWRELSDYLSFDEMKLLGSNSTSRITRFDTEVRMATHPSPRLELLMDRLEHVRYLWQDERTVMREAISRAIELVPDRFGALTNEPTAS
ncbi:MAG: hypothetical protein QM831_10245 [Kofleriaceae bacterium]